MCQADSVLFAHRSWNQSNAIAASSRPTRYSPTKKGLLKKVATSSRLVPKTASRLIELPQTSVRKQRGGSSQG